MSEEDIEHAQRGLHPPDAQAQLNQVRGLMAIADAGEEETQRKIGDLIAMVVAGKDNLPAVNETRRLVKAGADVLEDAFMDAVPAAFLVAKEKEKRLHLDWVRRRKLTTRSWETRADRGVPRERRSDEDCGNEVTAPGTLKTVPSPATKEGLLLLNDAKLDLSRRAPEGHSPSRLLCLDRSQSADGTSCPGTSSPDAPSRTPIYHRLGRG
jgi:DNA-binding protein YbaB